MINSQNKRENGFYSSFCPLSCISWMQDKIDRAFFLVLGTRSCSFFIQTPRPSRLLNNTSSGTILFEESEVCMGINENQILSFINIVIKNYSPDILFLVGSCFIEVQKIDLDNLTSLIQKKINIPAVPVKTSGFYPSYADGEDLLLSRFSDLCPYPKQSNKQVVILGSLTKETQADFEKQIKRLKIPLGGFFPVNDINKLPEIGENTLLAPLSPHLGATLQRLKRLRKCEVLSSLYPLGPGGSRDFFENICKYFNIKCSILKEDEKKNWEHIKDDVLKLKGMKAFFIGDSLLELPLARFLAECGAEIMELGVPYINSIFHKYEADFLSQQGVSIVEAPDNRRQLEKIKNLKPDMVFSPLSLSYPLKALGLKPVWSVKFFRPETSFYGFEKSDILIKTFVNSLRE
ncbi:MAG: Light-independent protochlorophyllide reductase subunit N [uncultured bacterium]|nr:MAG: Light-independent protochlorophyllide reductase subunit N [uncultured bacterium]